MYPLDSNHQVALLDIDNVDLPDDVLERNDAKMVALLDREFMISVEEAAAAAAGAAAGAAVAVAAGAAVVVAVASTPCTPTKRSGAGGAGGAGEGKLAGDSEENEEEQGGSAEDEEEQGEALRSLSCALRSALRAFYTRVDPSKLAHVDIIARRARLGELTAPSATIDPDLYNY
jgi:phage tail tape-measure protein